MPRYYTRRSEVDALLRPGQKVQFKRGRGYFLSGTALPYEGYVDPAVGRQQATSQVEEALAPVLEILRKSQAEAEARAQRERESLTQYYQWAAGEAKGIGPAIEQSYSQGAQAVGAYGKGFSIGMQEALNKSAGEGNQLLAQNNAPAGQQLQGGEAAADALYGISGALPAQAIEQQGRAFGAAARYLPVTAAGIGGQELNSLLDKQREGLAEYSDQIAELEAQRPGLIQKAIDEFNASQGEARDYALKQRAQRVNEDLAYGRLGVQEYNAQTSRQRAKVSAAQGRERLDLQWANLEFKNKQAVAKAKRAAAEAEMEGRRPNAALSKVYGHMVDANGQPILDANGKRIPVKKSAGKGSNLSASSKSIIVSRATDAGTEALGKYTDGIWSRTKGASAEEGTPEYQKATDAYQARLKANYGNAMRVVMQAIGPHLRALGYTTAQVRREAARIVGQEIPNPRGQRNPRKGGR